MIMQADDSAGREGPASTATGALLSVRDVSIRFGGIVALSEVSFEAYPRQVCSVIGPNGAGKTTLFNCVSRLYKPQSGSIVFAGHKLEDQAQHQIAGLGLGRTFQNLALFGTMSVLDNVMVGAHHLMRRGFLANAFHVGVEAEERRIRERAVELCALVGLESHLDTEVAGLPFGIQKRVELARALAAAPRMLMLDEPAAGLNHEEIGGLRDLIRRICEEMNIAVLLVEHHMNLVMSVSDKVVVLNFGRKIAEGTPDQVRVDPSVMQAYLGGGET